MYDDHRILREDIAKLRQSFESRYQTLNSLKNRCYSAKAAKRSMLDLNKLCKEHEIT